MAYRQNSFIAPALFVLYEVLLSEMNGERGGKTDGY